MRIIVLFNLKAGVAVEDYERWARGSDVPAVNALGSVDRFTIHRATGLFGSEASPPFQYVEIIDIVGIDPFVADITTPEFQAIAAPFRDFADDPVFIMTEDL